MKRDIIKQVRLNKIETEILKMISKNKNESEVIRDLIQNEFNKQRKERAIEAEKQLKEYFIFDITGLETLEITNLIEDLKQYKLLIDRSNNEIKLQGGLKE